MARYKYLKRNTNKIREVNVPIQSLYIYSVPYINKLDLIMPMALPVFIYSYDVI